MKPNQMKFRAKYRGQTIENGDYWHPYIKRPSPDNCYAVIISSAGIHYCGKNDIDHVDVFINGENKTFYSDFEMIHIWIEDVELEVISGD